MKKKTDVDVVIEKIERFKSQLIRPKSEIVADFKKFEQILLKWQKIQNLVSRETLDMFWLRHIADSLQLLRFFNEETKLVIDFGSGGGFPAIVLAIACKGSGANFVLVESNSRKVAFLRAVRRELDLSMVVEDSRIEDFRLGESVYPDIITARALACLEGLLGFSHPVWGVKTQALFLKGKEYAEELEKARVTWRFNVLIEDNMFDNSGVVLKITDLDRKHTKL